MTITAPEPLQDALDAVGRLLDRLPGKSMLIGGIAVIANGHVRTTDDIDATLSGRRRQPATSSNRRLRLASLPAFLTP